MLGSRDMNNQKTNFKDALKIIYIPFLGRITFRTVICKG